MNTSVNWQGKQLETFGRASIHYAAYAYAIIPRKIQGRIPHDILVIKRKRRDIWELPGGQQLQNTVGKEGVIWTCSKTISLPVVPKENDKRREEFFFSQILYRDFLFGDEADFHVSVMTYFAELPRGKEDEVRPAEGSDVVEVKWMHSQHLRYDDVHALCRPALSTYQSIERNEYPL